jgi:hypothetical protein
MPTVAGSSSSEMRAAGTVARPLQSHPCMMTSKPIRPVLFLAAVALSVAACDGSNDGALGRNGAFDSLTLASSGGMPWPSQAGDECNASYANTVTVVAASATIGWDTCGADTSLRHTVLTRGSRTLTADELASVRTALAAVQVGNRGACGADKAVVTLDVSVDGVTGRYVEDFYGCQPPVDGRTFVMNTSALEYALWNLVQKPAITT